ncbi:MAG: magnesium transporter [Christensenellales bacterium]|jgi:magnesium transporter
MDWDRIKEKLDQLLEQKRHSELRGALMMLKEVDIAEYMKTLDRNDLLVVFRVLPKDMSSDVFAYLDNDERTIIIESMGDAEVGGLINEMFIDDAVDFLEELPASVVKRVLQNADPERRKIINQFLMYPEYSAGSIMTIEYCEFVAGITTRQALDEIRKTGIDKETIYTIYVIDDKRHLIGTVPLRKLILASEDTPILSLMDGNVISVNTLDDQETVADTVRKYDLMSIPVVDNENRLVGIITVDDIMDVIEEENTEDFEKMSALVPSDDTYLKTSVFRLAINRLPWLLILMVSAMFTGAIITNFENVLSASAIGVTLMSCVPMLMDTGGNCGSQASTLAIRGLALGEIEFRDILRVLWKETRIAIMIGAVLAILNFLRLYYINHTSASVAAIVAISMFFTVLIAKSIGCILPLVAKRVRLDPALMASPLITTIVDACSLAIMFSLASKVLGI